MRVACYCTQAHAPPIIFGVPLDWERLREQVRRCDPIRVHGRVIGAVGLMIESQGPPTRVGELCLIERGRHKPPLTVEVVGFRNGRTLLMPLGALEGVEPNSEVIPTHRMAEVEVGESLLGRVLDGLGHPIDGKPTPSNTQPYPLIASAPSALERPPLRTPLPTGIRAIDALLTCAQGQRVGIFAGSGVGKSTLMGMLARHASAEVNVIALIGERGREVREFIEESLGEEGLMRSVLVVATSDQPAIVRQKCAFTATAIAEYFRNQGKQVLLMMDSLTRLAMAQREIGLSAGEPPSARGYTPSVFALMPQLLERAGTSAKGAITAFYTVLVDADDMNDPIADTARAILDGHIVLSRALTQRGHYPPIDPLASLSRVMPNIVDPDHQRRANLLRRMLSAYRDAEDLLMIGAYQKGANPLVDFAVERMPAIRVFLQQAPHEHSPFDETLKQLHALTDDIPDTL